MATRSHAAATAPPALSRERIARAGLELSDREGVEGLSMRRLARELGVTPMALYVHFRNKDELIDMVVDLGARELSLPSERGPWKRQLGLLMSEIRRGVERHPGALQVRRGRPLMSLGVMRGPELGLRIMLRARPRFERGLDDGDVSGIRIQAEHDGQLGEFVVKRQPDPRHQTETVIVDGRVRWERTIPMPSPAIVELIGEELAILGSDRTYEDSLQTLVRLA